MPRKLSVKPKSIRMKPPNPPGVIYAVRYKDGVMFYTEKERVAEVMATVDPRIVQIFTYSIEAELTLPPRGRHG